ncbi:MAG: hypothetical protein ACR2OB_15010 [Solirubrobacteraceae bacterium]
MNDDWRLRIDLHEDERARELTDRLEAFDLEHDLQTSFDARVVVSRDGPEVFCYAATREQAQAAERAIRSVSTEHGWPMDCTLAHWHPSAQEWEDPDEPLPDADGDRAAERARLMEKERNESAAQGYPEFEVRVQCASHRDALRLVETLRAEGVGSVQRWQFVVLGAADEDSARALAQRLRHEAPETSTITVEGSASDIIAQAPLATPFNSPFAVFGGLGG